MSDHEPTQAYVYQPFGSVSNKTHAEAGRLWGVGGIDRTTFLAECKGLTRPEADAVCAAIRATQGTDPEAVETPDPTVHALAVLGARVVEEAVRGEIPPKAAWPHLGGLTTSWQDMDGEWQSDYATPQIAATVARLTTGDGNG